MPYLGNGPAAAYTSTTKDSFSGDGSTTAFTMSKSANVNAVRVVVENVVQDPSVAYTCSGTTLTFTSAPPSGTNNIYVVHLGPPAATVAPPTTINNATTFTSDLTVDTNTLYVDSTNNRVGILNTSPSHALDVTQTGATSARVGGTGGSGANDGTFIINNGGTGDAMLRFDYETNTDRARIGTSTSSQQLEFYTAGNNERMRIDDAGRVLIGTTTEGAANEAEDLTISSTGQVGITIRSTDSGGGRIYFSDGTSGTPEYAGYQIYNHSDNAMIFGTNATERMRVDSNGKFMVGKTAANAASQGFETGAGNVGAYSTISSGNTWHVHNTANYGFYVNANGGIYNYQSNNVNLSDQREKKNIETLDDKWDAVKAWTLKKFHYNSDEDSDAKRFGVIAQDLETNHPELIAEFKKTDDETRKAVKEQQMMWMAVKALQEAMAKIETLETKVAALEAE